MTASSTNHRIATLNLALPIVNSVPAKIFWAASEPAVDSTPVTLVSSVTMRVSHRLNPRRMKNVPSVTMKLGSPERTTMNPLRKPMVRAMASAIAAAIQMLSPVWTLKIAANIPVVPVITPADRSNSPPIMSRATASAVRPYRADVSR